MIQPDLSADIFGEYKPFTLLSYCIRLGFQMQTVKGGSEILCFSAWSVPIFFTFVAEETVYQGIYVSTMGSIYCWYDKSTNRLLDRQHWQQFWSSNNLTLSNEKCQLFTGSTSSNMNICFSLFYVIENGVGFWAVVDKTSNLGLLGNCKGHFSLISYICQTKQSFK